MKFKLKMSENVFHSKDEYKPYIHLGFKFKKFKDYFNEEAKKVMVHDKYIFDFPGLHATLKSEESKTINHFPVLSSRLKE